MRKVICKVGGMKNLKRCLQALPPRLDPSPHSLFTRSSFRFLDYLRAWNRLFPVPHSEPGEPSVNYISGYRYQGYEIEGQVIHAWSTIQNLQVEFETWKSNVKYRIFHFNVKFKISMSNSELVCQIQNFDVKFKTSMLDIKLRCRIWKSRLKFETWMSNSDVEFWRR